jgi:microsomal epoxide hydrolase
MALQDPDAVKGIHLNLCFYRGPESPFGSGLAGDTATAAEVAWAKSEASAFGSEFQYFLLQANDPVTVSYAMMDSPVGQAAWLLDKFLLWADRGLTPANNRFDRRRAITEIMIFLVTDSFYPATTIYQAVGAEGPITLDVQQRVEVPVGFSAFPDRHCPPPPAELIRRSHNLVRYTEMPMGGHFPALEVPDLLTKDVASFIRQVRKG